jgi:hypothetical protein
MLAAHKLIYNLMKSSFTKLREYSVKLIIPFITHSSITKEEKAEQFKHQFWKLELMSNWQKLLTEVTEMKYLYKIKAFIPIFFEKLYENQFEFSKLKYLLQILHDPLNILNLFHYLPEPEKIVETYKKEITNVFHEVPNPSPL